MSKGAPMDSDAEAPPVVAAAAAAQATDEQLAILMMRCRRHFGAVHATFQHHAIEAQAARLRLRTAMENLEVINAEVRRRIAAEV